MALFIFECIVFRSLSNEVNRLNIKMKRLERICFAVLLTVVPSVHAGSCFDRVTDINDCRRIADQGDARAQYNLGMMYGNGEGVSRDYKESVKWFKLAAKQGIAQAQYNLGVMYGNGRIVPQDYKEAVKWYRLAADQGYAKAQ